MINSKVKKTLLILTSVILVIVIVTIAFISPISKYLIEKYDVKYTGREIKMDLLYVNPFTGNVYFRNLKILENKSDTVFFAATGLTVNFEMAKLLFKTYEISEVTLTQPIATVVQNKNIFNFTDLINKFAPDSTKPKEQKDTTPLHFNILDVNIINGTFYYDEKALQSFQYSSYFPAIDDTTQ